MLSVSRALFCQISYFPYQIWSKMFTASDCSIIIDPFVSFLYDNNVDLGIGLHIFLLLA